MSEVIAEGVTGLEVEGELMWTQKETCGMGIQGGVGRDERRNCGAGLNQSWVVMRF